VLERLVARIHIIMARVHAAEVVALVVAMGARITVVAIHVAPMTPNSTMVRVPVTIARVRVVVGRTAVAMVKIYAAMVEAPVTMVKVHAVRAIAAGLRAARVLTAHTMTEKTKAKHAVSNLSPGL
jgi:hypothetical protein